MRRAFTAGVAWSVFAISVFTFISCRTAAPETIAAGETCFRCRRVITDERLAAEMLNNNLPTKYKSPACIARYIKGHPTEDMQIWVTDYTSGVMIDPQYAYFVPFTINDKTGEHDFKAFLYKDAALREAKALGVGAVRWSVVLDKSNTNALF
jgi:hypothetical protein